MRGTSRLRWVALVLAACGAFGCAADGREPSTAAGGGGGAASGPPDGAPSDGPPAGGTDDGGMPAEGGPPDGRVPGGELPLAGCPAHPRAMELSVRPYDPADDRYHPVAEGVSSFEATVVSVTPDGLTLRPSGEAWQIAITLPRAVEPPLNPGDVVSVDLGSRTPFWQEWALVIRTPAGLVLAALTGELSWLDEPLFRRDDLTVTLGAVCPRRETECQDQVDHELVFSGGGDPLSLLGGGQGAVMLHGRPYTVDLATASTAVGEDRCTDQPASWVSFLIYPTP